MECIYRIATSVAPFENDSMSHCQNPIGNEGTCILLQVPKSPIVKSEDQ